MSESLEELEKAADDARGVGEVKILEELEIDDSSPVARLDALEQVTHYQASHGILTFAYCRCLHTRTFDVCLFRLAT